MKSSVLESSIEEVKKSLNLLNLALNHAKGDERQEETHTILFDGMIKRFEALFMRSVKLLGLALAREGIETLSPRAAIQEGVRLNWIKNPDFWLIALDARASSINGSSSLSNQEFLNIVTQFSVEAEIITSLLTELNQ